MIRGLIRFELKKNLKDKGLLFWMLVLPILFIVLFGYIFGNQSSSVTFDVPYVDEDQSMLSEQFVSALDASETFELQPFTSRQEAIAELESNDITSLIYLPAGFEERIMNGEENAIFLHYSPVEEQSVAPIRTLIENVSHAFQQEGLRVVLNEAGLEAESLLTPSIQLVEEHIISDQIDPITHIIPGYTVMFTFFIMISMVISFVKDLQSGMVARLASTPLSKYQYLFGKWVPYILIVLAQIVALFLFGFFV